MSTFTLEAKFELVHCGKKGCDQQFGMPENWYLETKRTGATWWCPKGHPRVWLGETTEQKLEAAEARQRHLQDQLEAAEREAENQRRTIIRERSRFANGVCPCCNRSFTNVRRHMSTKHPDYDVTRIAHTAVSPRFKCSCGRSFDSPRGLAVHQGHQRREGWETSTSRYRRHVTVIS